jgi:cell division protein FtsZ
VGGGAGLLRQPAAAAGAATALAAAPPVAQAQVYVEEMPQPVMVQPAAPPPVAYQPPYQQPSLPEAPPAGQGAGWRGLFRNATGLMRRNVEETPAPPRAEPVASQQPRAPQPMRSAPQQPDEMGLDIPTFLRRQNN